MVKREIEENVTRFNMQSAKISIILLLGVFGAGCAKEICPRMCTCDVFEGFRRADCR